MHSRLIGSFELPGGERVWLVSIQEPFQRPKLPDTPGVLLHDKSASLLDQNQNRVIGLGAEAGGAWLFHDLGTPRSKPGSGMSGKAPVEMTLGPHPEHLPEPSQQGI